MKSLTELRNEIDHIDYEIIKLLEKRFGVVKDIKKYKTQKKLSREDLQRESQILSRIHEIIEDDSCLKNLESVYKAIFTESKKVQG